MSLTLRYAARSDRGLIREGNEDSVYAGPRLLAVADGMGGMAAGEVASNIVVGALAHLDEDAPSNDLVDALRAAINDANTQLRSAVEENPALEGMGTTLTAMMFSGKRLALVHVGDSRAYVMRGGEMTQITRDDTYVQMLVDEGRITADEATTHPQRSLLTRALDGRDVDPDFSVREATIGDRYLLCSDGLSTVVSPDTIADALMIPDPGDAADRLISLALRGGGPDNITCIVSDIVDTGLGDDAPVVGGAAARDRGRTSSANADSAAGRAALARPDQPGPAVDAEEPDEAAPPRHIVRNSLLGVGIVVVLVAGAFLGWQYTQSQYYVGATDDGRIAIYKGVSGSVAGVSFSSVDTKTDLFVEDLQQFARRDVTQTLPADSKDDASAIVERLRGQQLPFCDEITAGPTEGPGGTPSPSTTPSASPSASPGRSTTPSPTPTPSPTMAPLPTPSADPGVNCRERR